MTTFQRARSEEQREVRRRAILDTAAVMLNEMTVAQVTLNELSRRVGLAKSNVLRYFESREAILLELLDAAWQDWLAQLDPELGSALDADAGLTARGDQLAAALASSLARHPVLCDLLSAQAGVLEHNLSPDVAARYKRAAIADVSALAALVVEHMSELGEYEANRLAAGTVMVAGAVWSHSQPSTAMLAAYETDPTLGVMRLDFTATLRDVLEVLISGLLCRAGYSLDSTVVG
jgi:AcrR family transcriptional regulator